MSANCRIFLARYSVTFSLAIPEYLNEWMFVKLPYGCLSVPCTSQKPEIRTGSLERMGPSGKRLTMNAFEFCRTAASHQTYTTRATMITTTYADEEPLEIGGHLEDGAVRYFSDGRERRRWWLRGTMQ